MLLQRGVAKKNTTTEGVDQSIQGCAAEADQSEYFCRAGAGHSAQIQKESTNQSVIVEGASQLEWTAERANQLKCDCRRSHPIRMD